MAGQDQAMKVDAFKLQQQQRRLDLQKQSMEIDDYLADRPRRRAKSKADRLEAEREIQMAPKLDEQVGLSLDNKIDQLTQQIETRELEDIANKTGEVTSNMSQEDYTVYLQENVPREAAEAFDLTGNITEDLPRLQRLNSRAVHNIKQKRAIELEAMKISGKIAAAKENSGYSLTAVNAPLPDARAIGSVKSMLLKDPDFAAAVELRSSPLSSENLHVISTRIAARANGIMQQGKAKADAATKKYGDPTAGTKYLVTPDAAAARAIELEKAYLHTTKDNYSFLGYGGGKSVVMMSPEEASDQELRWVTQARKRAIQNVEGFTNWDAQTQSRYLQERYMKMQEATYQRALSDQISPMVNR